VAKVMDDRSVRAALSRTGTRIHSFTPSYGAPEQFDSSRGATGPWTDVFALALVAVELMSGRPPLDGTDVPELAAQSMNPDQRPTPMSRGVLVPDRVDDVFRRALAVDPAERHASASELWDALEAACRASSVATVTPNQVEMDRAMLSLPQPARASRTLVAGSPPDIESAPPAALTPARRREGSWRRGAAWGGAFALTVSLGAGALALSRPEPAHAELRPVLGDLHAQSRELSARFACPTGMVKIPRGQFYQGSEAPSALANEKPEFHVKLDAYCIDITEVTQHDYLACSDTGRCKRPSAEVHWPDITQHQIETYSPLCNVNDRSRGEHPVNCVDWSMAHRYCAARGARLPTEAEWEYAARGPDGRVYPWGDEDPTPRHLNACGNECVAWGKAHDEALPALFDGTDGFATTAPVGHFPAGRSRFGLMDVVGNVWEWVADWSAPYAPDEKVNPTGPSRGERRVIRGGGWNGSFKSWLRPSFRYAQDPSALSHGIGFRCAASLPRPAP
jgi:formylglycine-generating enzyme required for sulfatase activity